MPMPCCRCFAIGASRAASPRGSLVRGECSPAPVPEMSPIFQRKRARCRCPAAAASPSEPPAQRRREAAWCEENAHPPRCRRCRRFFNGSALDADARLPGALPRRPRARAGEFSCGAAQRGAPTRGEWVQSLNAQRSTGRCWISPSRMSSMRPTLSSVPMELAGLTLNWRGGGGKGVGIASLRLYGRNDSSCSRRGVRVALRPKLDLPLMQIGTILSATFLSLDSCNSRIA
jgi:hypothetical protein